MKVCLVAPVSRWRGGMHQYSVHLANSLAEKSDLAVVGFKKVFPLWLYPGESKKISGEVALRPGVALYETLKYYSLLSAFQAAKIIGEQIRPDVVHIQWIAPQHGFVLIPLMLFLRRIWGERIFLTVHNISPHEARLFDRALSRRAIGLAHGIFVHAEVLKDEIGRMYGEESAKITVIPHGLCAGMKAAAIPRREARQRLGIREEKVILFFGFVRPYKGLSDLIIAFKSLPASAGAALVIAGEFFSGMDEYRAELRRQGIAERTYLFPRYISYEEVPLFFSAADILVQPYRRFSGQSGVTQTAYLYSVPVVATAVGGLPELVLHEKTGLLVEPGNPQALAGAVEKLLADAERCEEFGRNGRRFLEEQLSWEHISRRLVEAYGSS